MDARAFYHHLPRVAPVASDRWRQPPGARQGDLSERQCVFLVAAPVKSFDSGDSNRDLHMLQTVRGAQFPMVSVRTQLPESTSTRSPILADLDVELAGQTVHYRQVPFASVTQGNVTRISGVIPMTLADFKIDPPSLFTIPVKNEVPVRVDLTWRKQ